MELDYKYNDPADPFYERSDHYNFAKNGVPFFIFNGVHADYHQKRIHQIKLNTTP
jgi:Zn-dependent M28 family amino/carboxypeptidase